MPGNKGRSEEDLLTNIMAAMSDTLCDSGLGNNCKTDVANFASTGDCGNVLSTSESSNKNSKENKGVRKNQRGETRGRNTHKANKPPSSAANTQETRPELSGLPPNAPPTPCRDLPSTGQHTSPQPTTSQSESLSASDFSFIKTSLLSLTEQMNAMAPVVKELKSAYDDYNCLESEVYANCSPHNSDDELSDDSEVCLVDSAGTGPMPIPPSEKVKQLAVCTDKTSDPLVKQDNASKQSEAVGPAIDTRLSDILTSLLSRGMDADAKTEALAKLNRPKNCARLVVSRTNPEIFNNARRSTRLNDTLLQKAQKSLIGGINMLVQLFSDYVKAEKGKGEIPRASVTMSALSETLSLLADSCHDLDIRRRSLYRPHLHDNFKPLCSDTEPVTTLLFGDELNDTVKTLTETNRVSKQLTNTSGKMQRFTGKQQQRYMPYQPHRRLPFLGQRPPRDGIQPQNRQTYRGRATASRARPMNKSRWGEQQKNRF